MTTDPLVGQEVDGYRILDELGRGGMGIVYKVQNVGLKRVEALKIITPLLVRDDQFLRRFQLEAQALAQIHHTNIVTVYTMRQSTLGHYITMEYVEGETLADYLARQSVLRYQRAFPFIKQLLSAFSYAHERGIIHRDIKPRNIMLTPDGTVKVMDFGLAKFYLQHDVTQSIGLSGTLKYMSPEQIKGHKLDQRSDLFSLGITLYEMLSGRLPFDAGDSQFGIQRAIVEDPFPTLHSVNTAIPASLSAIVMKALEKDPDQRYRLAGEMLEAIEAFEEQDRPADQTVTLEAATPLYTKEASSNKEASSTTRVRTWRRVLALTVVLLAVVGGALALAPGVMDRLTGNADKGSTPTDTTSVANNAIPETQAPTGPTDTDGAATGAGDQATGLPALSDPDRAGSGEADSPQDRATARRRQDALSPEATTPRREAEPINPTRQEQEGSAPQEAANPGASTTPVVEPGPAEARIGTQQPEATTADTPAETTPAAARHMVIEQAPIVAAQLKRAMTTDSWSGLPEPIAEFYRKKLKDLPRKFSIKGADVIIDPSALQAVGFDSTLPVTVFLTIQQKGRDGTQAIPIPSLWIWKMVAGRMTLVTARDQ